ncbi:MAG: Amuc_1099 family pilus-like system protein [Chthoniobacterales bacterium]
MDWLRTNYDRVAVIVAALFLALSGVLILKNAVQFNEQFAALRNAGLAKPAAAPPKAAEIERATTKLNAPSQWLTSGRSGLFVPEKHFIGANGLPATLHTTEVHPPVPNEWLEQFNLPIADADVLTQDADNDGFNNLEEWQGHTNPIEAASHPPYVSKLRMRSFVQEPFQLVFASWVENTFAINTSDLKQPTQFVKIGDSIRGTNFKVINFTEKYDKNQYGTKMDVSELTLQNQQTGDEVSLVKEKIMISPESVANFTYPLGEKHEFAVKKDQEFSLKPEEQIKYKLLDVQPDKAVLVNEKTGERVEIGLLTPGT